jgi:hypothetical protein
MTTKMSNCTDKEFDDVSYKLTPTRSINGDNNNNNNSLISHPELVNVVVVSASQVTMISKRKMMSTSASFDLMTSTSSSSSLRHPAIPPIKEEVLSDLYEVVPDPLEPEEEAVCMQQAGCGRGLPISSNRQASLVRVGNIVRIVCQPSMATSFSSIVRGRPRLQLYQGCQNFLIS